MSTVPPSAAPPEPHPDPPAHLASQPLPITVIRAGTAWLRIYSLAFSPRYFDASNRHRFNAPDGGFGVLYAGSDDHCAFIETFGRDLRLRVVTLSELAVRGRSSVRVIGDLRLVDLTGRGLATIRADGRLTTGDYRVAQRWSLAFYSHPDRPDGIMWRSRFDPARICFAVYDRAGPSVEVSHLCSLADPTFTLELASILDHYDFGLV